MLGSNLTEQKANIQRLKTTIEEMKDSKQAADTKHQQTLDQHKVISQYLCTTYTCRYNAITYVQYDPVLYTYTQ